MHSKQEKKSYKCAEKMQELIERQKQWIDDLHSGMYINCVYCGHRYGPKEEVPASMAEVLKEHIEQCQDHPMSKLKTDLQNWKELAEGLANQLEQATNLLRLNVWPQYPMSQLIESVRRRLEDD